jgi:2-polyprenyl-3-methyl-5-hydroxy-6-metoxy-1,4-benzoquinol methylase
MLYESKAIVARAAQAAGRAEAISLLRELPLDDFGLVLLDPTAHGVGKFLPKPTPDEIQKRWTGSSGVKLLAQSLAFMRATESLYARFRHQSLRDKTILDYGCGWGRLLRLALHYTDSQNLIGADAWDVSLQFCRDAEIPATLMKIDARATTLPPMPQIDLAYCFSVLTHLPEDVARSVLAAVRRVIPGGGLFIFTFRPIEYWDHHQDFTFSRRDALKQQHREDGFAYQPIGKPDAIYGDTSISHAYLDHMLNDCGWRRLAFDRTLADPLQEIVVVA